MEKIEAKKLISSYRENDLWFDANYGMNIYKGCPHGCIYCDSRSSCYNIIDFDKVRAKENVLEILERDLKSKRKKGIIGTGAMSDPYNPLEKKYEYTREALKLINKYGFGVAIDTKSSLITRDIDILKKIQEHSPVIVKVTITTFDDKLGKLIEPNVSTSSERFKAVKKLRDNGIYTGILMMPILPFINDTEENIRNLVKEGAKAGAKFIFSFGIGVTLRGNQREHFFNKLKKLFPKDDLVHKYINTYGESYECPSPNWESLWSVFTEECEKNNILYKMEDIVRSYRKNYTEEQLSLF
ncbi:SPL family radical SAM protein [Clostridium massiliamazoniense]|uniref:SPL family radical SAM protein n=1 Tax=Clostridium massiliamazoniense TaxID=1347366 RepID=UPI0006D806B8|nr:radical SAM protein [Clostridium massiliamazoniense]